VAVPIDFQLEIQMGLGWPPRASCGQSPQADRPVHSAKPFLGRQEAFAPWWITGLGESTKLLQPSYEFLGLALGVLLRADPNVMLSGWIMPVAR
jgi:hypothetical protein